MKLLSKRLLPAACLLPQRIHLAPELWASLQLLPFRERAELYADFRVGDCRTPTPEHERNKENELTTP